MHCLCGVLRRRYWPSNLPLSCEVVESSSTVFGLHFFAEWRTRKKLRQFATVVYPLPWGAKFGWVLLSGVCVRSPAMKKTVVLFLTVSGPKFMKFWGDVGDPLWFVMCFPVVYIMFLAGDIGPQICHWVAQSSKIGRSWAPSFVGVNTQKYLRSVCLLGRLKTREWKMRYGQNCKGGKCRSGKCRSRQQGWKMQE